MARQQEGEERARARARVGEVARMPGWARQQNGEERASGMRVQALLRRRDEGHEGEWARTLRWHEEEERARAR